MGQTSRTVSPAGREVLIVWLTQDNNGEQCICVYNITSQGRDSHLARDIITPFQHCTLGKIGTSESVSREQRRPAYGEERAPCASTIITFCKKLFILNPYNGSSYCVVCSGGWCVWPEWGGGGAQWVTGGGEAADSWWQADTPHHRISIIG